jgi:fused signal recognition particle receptor
MAEKSDNKIRQGLKRSREGWFGKIAGLFSRQKIEAETWDELEELLISADVGVSTSEKLIQRVKQRIKDEKVSEGDQVRAILKKEIVGLLRSCSPDEKGSDSDKLKIVMVVGVNGSGKTTSIAKLAYEIRGRGKHLILAAADTFRPAAIEQLKQWGERAGVQVIAHQQGGDPGAVVFDAIQAAQNRDIQVVIVDTAGRLHTKFNLMEELKKIKRIVDKYDAVQETLLVIDATTGQNGLVQARQFSEATGVNGIFLTKLDGTAKGGIVLAICDELKIPIRYIGTGEQIDDLSMFDAESFADAMFAG